MAQARKRIIIIGISACVACAFFASACKGNKASSPERPESGGKPLSVSAAVLAAGAKEAESSGKLSTAKTLYQQLITDFANSSAVGSWQKKLDELTIKLLFSPVVTPKSTLYEIQPGDTLAKIARDFKTTVDLLKISNNIKNDMIRPGEKIKVWTAPFTIIVDKSQNILMLKADEEIIKTYVAATGVNNSTPVGTYTITNKIINPTWFKSGAVIPPGAPDNLLGTRWIGFDLAGYGIHGTSDPQSLGRQVTQGCVRLSNPDIEELYTIVPEGTEVTIID
jgi:lipoprotein-anchoring transpeptidase ErfK/SrfK